MEIFNTAAQLIGILAIMLAAFGVCVLICMASMLVDEYRHNKGGR